MSSTHHKQDQPTYPFKILSQEEIIDYLNKINLNIEKSQLSKINPSFFHEILLHLIISMNLSKREDFSLSSEESSLFSYSQLHEKQVYILKLYFKLSRILTAIGIYDFSTVDLFSPSDSRSLLILSGLISLYKTYETIFPSIKSINSEKEKVELEIKRAEKEMDERNEEKEMLNSQYLSRMKDAEVKSEELSRRHKIVLEKQVLLNEKEEKLRMEKLRIKEIDDHLTVILNEVDEKVRKNDDLTQKIVDCPNKVNSKIGIQEKSIPKGESILNKMNVFKNRLSSSQREFNDIHSFSNECVSSYNSYLNINNEYNSILNSLFYLKDKLKELQKELVQMENENIHLKEEEMMTMKRRNEEESLFSIKNKDNTMKINGLRHEKQELIENLNKIKGSLNDIKASFSDEEQCFEKYLLAEENILKEYEYNISRVLSSIENLFFSLQNMLPQMTQMTGTTEGNNYYDDVDEENDDV